MAVTKKRIPTNNRKANSFMEIKDYMMGNPRDLICSNFEGNYAGS